MGRPKSKLTPLVVVEAIKSIPIVPEEPPMQVVNEPLAPSPLMDRFDFDNNDGKGFDILWDISKGHGPNMGKVINLKYRAVLKNQPDRCRGFGDTYEEAVDQLMYYTGQRTSLPS